MEKTLKSEVGTSAVQSDSLARVVYVPDSWCSIRLEASQVPGVIMIDSSQE